MSKAGLTSDDMARHYRREIEQLKVEAALPRMKVSECMQSLLNYTLQFKNDDFLSTGVTAIENPFQEKKKCHVL